MTFARNIRVNGVVGLAVLLLVAGGAAYMYFGTAKDVTITVQSMQVDQGDDYFDKEYRVETEGETFDVGSEPLSFGGSGSTYRQLEVGRTYECRVTGVRILLVRRTIRRCTEKVSEPTAETTPAPLQSTP